MISTNYSDGTKLSKYTSNGVVALNASITTGVDLVRLPAPAVFIVEDDVYSVDTWEGTKRTRRYWKKGSVAFLPANTELTCTPDHPYRENMLSLDSDRLISKCTSVLEGHKVELFYDDITSEEITTLARLLHRMVESGEHAAWPLFLDSLVLAMTVAVCRHYSATADKIVTNMENASGMTSARMSRVLDFIEANIGERIQLEQLAEAAALSPYHFSRSFKKATGKTPLQYVMERRVREAMALLKTTSKSAAEIAHECGFASQSHFAGAFKAEVGHTPGEFRRIMID